MNRTLAEVLLTIILFGGGSQAILAQDMASARLSSSQSLQATSCYTQTACNETVTGNLGPGDCVLTDNQHVYVDVWQFSGGTGQGVTADAYSPAFFPYLALFNPSGNFVATEKTSPNFYSELTYNLDATGLWSLAIEPLTPYETGSYSLEISCTGTAPPPSPSPSGPCVVNDTTLCIDENPGDSRYQITVDYTSNAGSGHGHAVALDSLGFARGGMFWFFDKTNPEMLIKVLHGCGVNNYHWVFFAATTNVGLVVTVTDTQTGVTRTYTNPNGHPANPITDTTAFSCP